MRKLVAILFALTLTVGCCEPEPKPALNTAATAFLNECEFAVNKFPNEEIFLEVSRKFHSIPKDHPHWQRLHEIHGTASAASRIRGGSWKSLLSKRIEEARLCLRTRR